MGIYHARHSHFAVAVDYPVGGDVRGDLPHSGYGVPVHKDVPCDVLILTVDERIFDKYLHISSLTGQKAQANCPMPFILFQSLLSTSKREP